jgi:uncharacterized membrane protein
MEDHKPKPSPKKKVGKAKKKKLNRSFFLRGVITILPAVMTLFILVTVVQFARNYVTTPINSTIYWMLEGNTLGWKVLEQVDINPLDAEFLDEEALPQDALAALREGGIQGSAFKSELEILRNPEMHFFRDLQRLAINPYRLRREVRGVVHPLVGVLVSVLVVLILGYITSGFVGRRMIASVDRAAQNLPIIRSVYPYAKQLVEFFADDKEFEFDTVVAAPYPSETVWAIAFVTGTGMRSINEGLGDRYVSVFVPTSPMPMTGFTVFLKESKLIPLPISVDEALRVTVSAGVLIPASQQVEDLAASLAKLGADIQTNEKGSPPEPGSPV